MNELSPRGGREQKPGNRQGTLKTEQQTIPEKFQKKKFPEGNRPSRCGSTGEAGIISERPWGTMDEPKEQ